ncbi:DUF6089 family protein [Kaistella antarctica]|uniref:DUF6089 domain-containing protein n=1 Tax=Kaistella antarctica TaxID=266748 RepID=A0A448NTR3_9FLAO|nr:DUF6089 family protein [Kaistella antarctica]KEY18270.1 hypothetical protein HY04_07050 [Kaistella antarctica]SEV84161.1 Outer membrane protein beta-barrel domain-containing protein [Kaistella antarctica]VEI00896.1 Uncharacterised protein [Kaistella antarctica]
MQKKVIYTLIALFFVSVAYKGQRHEIGVQLGMSNLVGDIGRTNYVLQKPTRNYTDYGIPFYGGILYRMNFNPYQTVRLNLGYSHIQFIDVLAKEQYRRNRKLSGTNSIMEADLIFEYNFFPVNDEQKGLLSPYIFGGLGAMYASTAQFTIANDFYKDSKGDPKAPSSFGDFETREEYINGKKLTMSIPFGIGLKYKFNYNWSLFGELMFRPTFSDSIDYSVINDDNINISYKKKNIGGTDYDLGKGEYRVEADKRSAEILKKLESRQIGNINSKDWVNTISIGLSYSFGRPPCYCD